MSGSDEEKRSRHVGQIILAVALFVACVVLIWQLVLLAIGSRQAPDKEFQNLSKCERIYFTEQLKSGDVISMNDVTAIKKGCGQAKKRQENEALIHQKKIFELGDK